LSAPRSSAPAWAAFERRGLSDKGSYFMGACPAHEDDKRSMTVTVGGNGAMLIKCFAGCKVEDIVEAVGVEMRDLWPPKDRPPATAVRVVARYDYVDEQGVLLYQVERTDPKGFRQRKPEGEGWSYKLGNVRRVLYRLPDLLAAPTRPVLLVEGEKDVDNLRKLKLVATTIAGGAGAWRPEYAEPLRDRTVIILPDNDEPGRQFAMQAATWILRSLIVVLPGLPEKGDASDWIAAGGTARQLGELARAAARAKVANAEEVAASLGRAA
jgi:putative DNA primase/helicase